MQQYSGTTILVVRRGGDVVMAGDGQVSLGDTVVKGNAKKVRRVYHDKVIAGFAGVVFLHGWGFSGLPTGFLPTEDQGYVFGMAQLPDSASLERTGEVVEKINELVKEVPGVADLVSVVGYSLIDGTIASNAATEVRLLD